MGSSKLGLTIAGFNVILYLTSGIIFSHFAVSSNFMVGLDVFVAVLSFILVAISGLLLLGIIKRRYILMAPWVYAVNVLNIVLSISFGSIPKTDPEIGKNDIYMAVAFNVWYSLMIWIPIFFLYQEIRCENMRDHRALHQQHLHTEYKEVP